MTLYRQKSPNSICGIGRYFDSRSTLMMKTEAYEAVYKMPTHWTDIDPEHEKKHSRFMKMNDSITRSYRRFQTEVLVEIKCNLMDINQEKKRVEITVACADMSYELIRFASTDLVLRFVDADMKEQTLQFYAAESECVNHRHRPHSAINCVPVTHISLYLTSKTDIPGSLLIHKPIADCTLTVCGRGVWPQKIKSWDQLSRLEVMHRCYMKMLFSEESVAAAYDIYNVRIDGDILLRMKEEGEPLSREQKQSLRFLQDLHDLSVDLAY